MGCRLLGVEMATFVPFKKFITFPRVIRAFKSAAKIFKAVKARPAYSRALNNKSRVSGQVDVAGTIQGRTRVPLLGLSGRKV